MPNLTILIESMLQGPCSAKLGRYATDVEAEGWTVTKHVVGATQDFITGIFPLLAGADHVQLFGHVPIVLLYFDPDGHGTRDGECDAPYCAGSLTPWNWNGTHFDPLGVWPEVGGAARTCGRVDFSGLGDYGIDEYATTNNWLDRNHDARTGVYTYTNRGFVVNFLEYMQAGLTAASIARLEAIVGHGNVPDLTATFSTDQFYRTYSPQRFVVGTLYSGGDGFRPFGHEYNIGIAQDVVDFPVNILLALHFCSNGWAFNGWPLQRLALAGGCQACLYGTSLYSGTLVPPDLSTWSTTVPLQAAIKPTYVHNSPYVFTIQGDGTMRLQSGAAPPPPPPPPGPWEQLTNDCYYVPQRTVIPY